MAEDVLVMLLFFSLPSLVMVFLIVHRYLTIIINDCLSKQTENYFQFVAFQSSVKVMMFHIPVTYHSLKLMFQLEEKLEEEVRMGYQNLLKVLIDDVFLVSILPTKNLKKRQPNGM